MKKSIYFIFISLFFILLIPTNSYAEELKDFFGKKFINNKKEPKILSLSPATTELLYSIGADKNIIAVTNDCNYPQDALKKDKIGKFGFINYEKLLVLKPDIIFATKDMGKVLLDLKKYNYPVFALDSKNLNSVIENIDFLQKVLNIKEQKNLNKSLKSKLDSINSNLTKKSTKPTVFYVIWHEPIITTGNNSFIGDMIKLSGGINIAKDINNPFAKYSIESLVKQNPDYLIIPESTYKKINFTIFPWNKLKAVKNNKIIAVNDDKYLRPTVRAFDSIEELSKKLK
ncbi:MAG: helical backbone metal receptor [Candidatus Sericytochromatia bacterium]